ncbi:MAG: carbamoyltransferase [Candidatus Acidiferrales bacterium]|jgi:carbamoyltransferase
MRILGISAFYHDSAAALVCDGRIVAAAQEERFSRKKHDSSFPRKAAAFCLEVCERDGQGPDYVVFYEKPFIKFERLLETYFAFAPRGRASFTMAMPLWIREKLFQRSTLKRELNKLRSQTDWDSKILFSEHHQSHAASAFYPSPFEEAAVLTMDGVGEWATTSIAIGRGKNLQVVKELHFPHSLGLLYSAFTYYTGFRVNSGEYKLMGLAPYGEPKFAQVIFDKLLDLKPDGSFRLNLSYFDFCTGLTMTNGAFEELFGCPTRKPTDLLIQLHMDLAASIQVVLEEVVLRMTRFIARETGLRNLCLAGGCALNCVANGKVLRDGHFDQIWVQPASGDAGGALGAALAAYHLHFKRDRDLHGTRDSMNGAFLGPDFSQTEIERRLGAAGATFEVLGDECLIAECVKALESGQALGWFQGRMEFGPRALGGRSILADARSQCMQSVLNLKVKYRESFRPFAPSILREDLSDWFDLDVDSPYMLLVAPVAKCRQLEMTPEQQNLFGIDKLNVPRSTIPAVTHVDYSARVQTVHGDTNPRYAQLLRAFKQSTGCPALVNTSFNVRGEPIVGTPEDAFRCFMGTEIDVLAIGNCFLRKHRQQKALANHYASSLEKD